MEKDYLMEDLKKKRKNKGGIIVMHCRNREKFWPPEGGYVKGVR